MLPGNRSLVDADPEMADLLQRERYRQWSELELIASENFTSKAVFECLGSCFTNKYSEGQPGRRYYGGNTYIDCVERLCKKRALEAFRLSPEEWYVNVQGYSGSPANLAVYVGMLGDHDRVMGLNLPAGGHLSHGAYRFSKPDRSFKSLSVTSRFWDSFPYGVTLDGIIDYDELEKNALIFFPKMIVAGASAYPRDWDYARLREIADKVGALLMTDIAHFAGLVAANLHNNPFELCDIVTTTTHKTLRGPRGALIFIRNKEDWPKRIDDAVFPGLQGGPHNNVIAGIATQLLEVCSPVYVEYASQVKKNSATLAQYLMDQGYRMMTDGTDNHLMLWDLRPLKITGSKVSAYFEYCNITLNKNCVAGDTNALAPGGVRIGSPALTSRGMKEADFVKVGEFLHRGAQNALRIQANVREHNDGKCLKKAFLLGVPGAPGVAEDEETKKLRDEVEAFAKGFPMPGFNVEELKYKDGLPESEGQE